jgi:hypothetical protein
MSRFVPLQQYLGSKRLLATLFCLILLGSCVFSLTRIARISKDLSVEPSITAIINYLDTNVFVKGAKQQDIFEVVHKINPNGISVRPNNEFIDKPYKCYKIEFYSVLFTRAADRLVCFDEQHALIWQEYVLALY